MLRIDLDTAGIPYVTEGPNGPEYADFHSLRHSYLTLGGRSGIDLRTLMELAGHSKPELTARYSHRRLYDLTGAVGKLPNSCACGRKGLQCGGNPPSLDGDGRRRCVKICRRPGCSDGRLRAASIRTNVHLQHRRRSVGSIGATP